MLVSLNELESLVLKAVRGAGLAWGLAEEAAAAAAWLACADLLLPGPLIARLGSVRETSPPVAEETAIRPRTAGTALCPILAGAWIADGGLASRRLEVREVLAPLWLSAVVARALPQGCKLIAEWPDARLVLGRGVPLEPVNSSPASLSAEAAGSVLLMVDNCDDGYHAREPRDSRGIVIHDADLRALQAFERLTYVPASEQSRLAGAGAGLLDGD